MRCADVLHELAVPTGAVERNLVSDHLAHCPSCARWAERNARLDQIWEATRAPRTVVGRLGSDLGQRLPGARSPAGTALPSAPVSPAPVIVISHPWRRTAVAVFVLAQAARDPGRVGLAWYQAQAPSSARSVCRLNPWRRLRLRGFPTRCRLQNPTLTLARPPPTRSEEMVFNLPASGTSVISFDDKTLRNLALNENPNEVDPLFNGFNDLESQAGLQ